MKLLNGTVEDARLLRRAQTQLREQATQAGCDRATADSRALAGALEGLRALSEALGERPPGAVLTTEGAWARVRGHLVFAAALGCPDDQPHVWRLSPQGWVPLALPDLFGEAFASLEPAGVLAAPLWGPWRRLRVLRHPQVLALIFAALVMGLGLFTVLPLMTLALWTLALLIWGARRWAVNRWFAAVEHFSLQPASLPLPGPPLLDAGA